MFILNLDDFKINIVDDMAIVAVDLLVATHRDAKPFWEELEQKCILKWEKVVIDLSFCTFIDSTFVGILVKTFRTISANKGILKLVFPESNAKNYVHTSGIAKIIDCYNTLDEAMDSLSSDIPIRKIFFEDKFHNN